MITTLVRRVVPLMGLAACLVLLVRFQHVPPIGSDAWLHLRLGEEFRDGWALSNPGHLGVFDSATWYPTQWASQIGMSWMDSRFGIGGVVWLAGTLILLLPVVIYLSCRRHAAPLPAALATFVAVAAAAPGLSARPQVISYLFVALVTAAWLETARDGRPRWWIVALTWVWVPLHGMWVVGISISVAAVIGIALARTCERRQLLRLAAIPLLSAAVSLATPLGLDVVRSVTGVGARNDVLTEWGPPDFTSTSTLFLVLMIAIVLLVSLRGGPLDWPIVALLGLSMAWGLYSVRTTVVAGVMLAPLVAMALQRLVPADSRARGREVATVAAMTVLASVGLAIVSAQRADEPVVAGWVDERLDSMPPGTRVLNDWELGHYAMSRHPQVQLVMHGYVDMFTTAELERNIAIATLEAKWDTEVTDLDVDYGFVDPDSRLGYALVNQLGWTTIEGDDDYVLLEPPAQS